MSPLVRLRTVAGCAMFGAVIVGCFGHHGDDVQWFAALIGSWIGALLISPTTSRTET